MPWLDENIGGSVDMPNDFNQKIRQLIAGEIDGQIGDILLRVIIQRRFI